MIDTRKTDEHFMKLAYAEALEALKRDEVPIGALIVIENKVIAKAYNLSETLVDATAHAEMQAFTSASNYLGGKYLDKCTLYVTIEPCPMCAAASYWVKLGRLVYGADDLKRGYSTISHNLLHPKTIITKGLMHDECQALLTNFFKSKR